MAHEHLGSLFWGAVRIKIQTIFEKRDLMQFTNSKIKKQIKQADSLDSENISDEDWTFCKIKNAKYLLLLTRVNVGFQRIPTLFVRLLG